MSLEKYIKNENDISPNITDESIEAFINNEKFDILKINRVEEYCGQVSLTAYLIQISLPENLLEKNKNILDIKIMDLDGLFGQASIFF